MKTENTCTDKNIKKRVVELLTKALTNIRKMMNSLIT